MPQSSTLGSPAVVGDAKPRDAAQQENDDWSRARVNVYPARNVARPPRVAPVSVTPSCFVTDCKPDSSTSTWPNAGSRRDAVEATAPVAGTIEPSGTYTGRPASSASVNCGVVERLRSRRPYWLTPRA